MVGDMPRAAGSCAMLLFAALACGTRSPEPARAPAAATGSGGRAAIAADGEADAGPGAADAGPVADAGLAEIGASACDAVVARFLACPGVPEDSKRQLAAAAKRWHEDADRSQDARVHVAADCLEIAHMTEQMLLELGC
jgi:hypothetical protein